MLYAILNKNNTTNKQRFMTEGKLPPQSRVYRKQ